MNRFFRTSLLLGALVVAAPLVRPLRAQPLENGVHFVPSIDRIAPRVAISLVARVGAADETAQNAGWRRLLVNAMLRSAPRGFENSAAPGSVEATESLARAAEKLGGEIGATVGDDTVEIWAIGNSENGVQLLQLALALLENPRLSDADISAARERLRVQSEGADSDLSSRVSKAIQSQIFRTPEGESAAYGLPELGSESSLDFLSNDVVRGLHSRLKSAKLTVGAAGDVDVIGMRRVLEARGAQSVRKPAAPIFAKPDIQAPAFTVREFPVPAASLFVSFPLGSVASADAPALRILVAALSQAREARLSKRLINASVPEEEQVLAVSGQWIERRYGSELLVSAQTGAQTVEKTKNVLIDETLRLKTAPLSKLELERARAFVRGSWSLERQNLRTRASLVALAPALHSAAEATFAARLAQVSAADVQRVAKRYLSAYAVALVMPRRSE